MRLLANVSKKTISILDKTAPWLSLLMLRILIGWEYLESGLEKFHGENWFTEIQNQFPFPFNIVPTAISWQMATWFEIVGGLALMIGFGTRFFSFSLIILTIVATAAVHWPADWHSFAQLMMGYTITDDGFGNFKLPVIFIGMLIPLLFSGPGKLSMDAFIRRQYMGR